MSAGEWIGRTVGNHRLTARIGAGGMGEVYRAVNVNTGGAAAIKVLSRRAAERPNSVNRFFAEARVVNHIRHPGIVSIYDLGALDDGTPYILMELLEGQPLSARIRHQGPLPVDEVLATGTAVLAALGAAHAAGVVHRDIKPDNVFVCEGGRVKLLDFGVAKLAPELMGGVKATQAGAMIGTPRYMAPEQIEGRTVDPRTDIYAVGLLLYEALAGRPAFYAGKLHEILRMQVEDQPMPLRTQRADVSPALEAVIAAALAKDPAMRHPSAEAMAAGLEQARARGLHVEARTTDLPAPAAPTILLPTAPMAAAVRASRGRWLAAAGVAGIVVLGASVAIGWVASRGDGAQDEPPSRPRVRVIPVIDAATVPIPRDADEFLRQAREVARAELDAEPMLYTMKFWLQLEGQAKFQTRDGDRCVYVRVTRERELWVDHDLKGACGDVDAHEPACTADAVLAIARRATLNKANVKSVEFRTGLWAVEFDRESTINVTEAQCSRGTE